MMVRLASALGQEFQAEAALIRDSWLGTALQGRGIPVTMLRNDSSLSVVRDLARLIRERQVSILHTHEFFMNTLGLVVSRWTGIPVVATVHGKNYYTDRLRRRAAYRVVGKFASQVVAVSEDVRRLLVERIGIPIDRIRVVPNGVPVDEQPSGEKISVLRRSLGLEPDSRVVGTVGSLYPVKGHKFLIDGAPHVIRRFPHVIFLIVGRGGLREELEGHVQQLGVARHFRFLGHREDVRDLLALCDVFVLPSLSEGMPLALLEAMGAGVPSVATRVGGVSEVVEHGKTAMVVSPGNSQALADSINTLLEDRTLAKEMGESARQVVARRFCLTGMVQAYREIYSELIRKTEHSTVRV
jgi:glycosyltransferase involved in cell wall biosynthesis